MRTDAGWWLSSLVTVRGSGWRVIGDWAPGIGDPSLAGWITVALYLIAAALCLRAARRLDTAAATALATGRGAPTARLATAGLLALVGVRRRLRSLPAPARARALWLGLAVVFLLLGINKALDVQTAFTEAGRVLAVAQGWYDESRRRVQAVFLAALAVGGLLELRAAFQLAREEPRGMRAVLAGTVFVVVFVVARATSFHRIDALLGSKWAGVRLNWVFEIGGVGFVILAILRVLWSRALWSGPDAGTR
jgi:hypothetical protein